MKTTNKLELLKTEEVFTKRKAFNKTMMAIKPINISYSAPIEFYLDAYLYPEHLETWKLSGASMVVKKE